MSFEIGQQVRIKYNQYGSFTGDMLITIGEVGEIRDISEDDYLVYINEDNEWWYHGDEIVAV